MLYPELQKSKHSGKHCKVGSNIGNIKDGALVGAGVGALVGALVNEHCTPSRVTFVPARLRHLHSAPRASSHSQKGVA